MIRSCVLVFALVALPGALGAELHRVAAGQPIAPVIAAAAPGDTVWLESGEYRENLVIDVPIRLTGEGRPHLRGGHEGVVIRVLAPDAIIEGLHISESGTRLIDDMACILVEGEGVTIRDNLIDEPLHGIYVKGVGGARIEGNRIEGRADLIEADRGNGIHLWNSRDNHIEGNEILEVRDGIYFSFADTTKVLGNHIHHVRYGLHYMYSNHNTFEDNLFADNVAGAALMYSSHLRFSRNVFARCRGFRAYGLLYQSMQDTLAEHNLFIDNSRGIFMSNSQENRIRHNDLVDNDLALQIQAGAEVTEIVGNNFINNLSELLLDVGEIDVDWGDESGGNYWSAYDGYDLDGDGLGDRPHTIQNVFQILESEHPEARFYLLSPAAKTLEMAEKAMPILELGRARDEAPYVRPQVHPEVPWARVASQSAEPSAGAALVYLLVAVVPFALAIRLGRSSRG